MGGEGGWDYLFADPVGRRLYIPRGGTPGARATDGTPARPADPGRIMVYNLDNLDSVGAVIESRGARRGRRSRVGSWLLEQPSRDHDVRYENAHGAEAYSDRQRLR